MIDLRETIQSDLMRARVLAFLVPEDGVDAKLIETWRAKVICACVLDVRFREAFFAELCPVMAKMEALVAKASCKFARPACGYPVHGSG
jgi:hypothetical protein